MCARFALFVVGWLLLAGLVLGETIPATLGTPDKTYWVANNPAFAADGLAALPGAICNGYHAQTCSTNGGVASCNATVGNCTTGHPVNSECQPAGSGYCVNGVGNNFSYVNVRVKAVYQPYVCPANQNWTLSGSNCTRPDCVLPQARSPSTGVCGVDCQAVAGQVADTGFFDYGTDKANTAALRVPCFNGCVASFSGTAPAKSQIVGGVNRYFAKGTFSFLPYVSADLNNCTGAPGIASGTVPNATCGTGTYLGSLNGKDVCIVKTNQTVAATSDPVTATTTSTVEQSVSGPNTTTTTTTTLPDGSQQVAAETVNTATGVPVSSSVTGPVVSSDSGGGDSGMEDFCTANPTAQACVSVSPGAAVGISGLYVADASGKTFSSVLAAFKATVVASPIYSAAGGFFSAGSISGVCSGLSATLDLMGTPLSVDASPYLCGATAATFYEYLALGLLLAATGIAFAIAIL